jgi:hypothetical protein
MQSEQEQAQTLVIANKGPTPLEIMVEMTPELYVLQPGDELEIEAVLNGAPFHINTSVGGLQIYPGNADDHLARTNGAVAASWS